MSAISSSRPAVEEVILDIAAAWSKRSTCPRLATGAVVASADGAILTSGYNGSPRGLPHCLDVECLMEGGHCVRAVHAEANAIIQAAREGVRINGAYLYAVHRPCVRCAIAIIQAGIKRVVYKEPYDTDGLPDTVAGLFAAANVELIQWEGEGA